MGSGDSSAKHHVPKTDACYRPTWQEFLSIIIVCHRFEQHNKTLAVKSAAGAVRPASAITGLGERAGWQAKQQQHKKHEDRSQQQLQHQCNSRPCSAGPGAGSRGPRDIFPVDLNLVSCVFLQAPLQQACCCVCSGFVHKSHKGFHSCALHVSCTLLFAATTLPQARP